MEMKRAVIFDMDGVIVDSELQWIQSEASFLKEAIPNWKREDFDRITGMSVKDLYTFLKKEFDFPYTFEEFWDRNELAGVKVYRDMVSMIPGFELLASSLKAHARIGLASSSPKRWINIVIERFKLEALFDCVVSADDVGGVGKPSPDIYLYAANSLGVSPSKCIAIEDSSHGILSAKHAGMKTVGFRNGFNRGQDLAQSDLILNGFKEGCAEYIRGLFD